MSEQTVVVTPQRRRSPSYPAFGLGAAIGWLKTLYAAEKQHAAPIETAVRHWGYKGPNGKTNLIISALKKYGLIVDSGSGRSRKIQVTDLGRRILEHPNEVDRLDSIRKAALLPPIHREMWEKYGANNMPGDETWVWELKEDRDFTDAGARDFVKEYRETVEFAKLGIAEEAVAEDDTADSDLADEVERVNEVEPAPARTAHDLTSDNSLGNGTFGAQRQKDGDTGKPVEIQSYPIPIALQDRPPVMISGAFPLTAAEWNQFKAVLEAMRPVLVKEGPEGGADRSDN